LVTGGKNASHESEPNIQSETSSPF